MKICFVCHGNICRSVVAEVIAKEYLAEKGIFDVEVISRATSREELGNDIYPPMKRTLYVFGYKNLSPHCATQIDDFDYETSDYIFYMDSNNLRNLTRMFEDNDHKFKNIALYTKDINEIEDPWYTGNYTKVFQQIKKCVINIFNEILDK